MDSAWFSECVFHKNLAVDLRVRATALASAASVCVPYHFKNHHYRKSNLRPRGGQSRSGPVSGAR